MARVRTNIELDEDHLRVVMDRYQLRTKTEAVDLALRSLAGRVATLTEVHQMRGAQAIAEVPPDAGP